MEGPFGPISLFPINSGGLGSNERNKEKHYQGNKTKYQSEQWYNTQLANSCRSNGINATIKNDNGIK